MSANITHPSIFGAIPACIVAAGMVVSAMILSHEPATTIPTVAQAAAAAHPTPPIADNAAKDQFKAQILAAPNLHTYRKNGARYTLANVDVQQVIYSAKDDAYTLIYDWTWRPAPASGVPSGGAATLSNNGYGHYSGPVTLDQNGGSNKNAYAYITIQ